MEARLHTRRFAWIFLAAILLAAEAAPGSQEPGQAPSDPASLPLEEWLQAGPIEEIPWKLRISKPYLRTDQRLAVRFRARVQAKDLIPNQSGHDLFWLVRVQDPAGHWLNSNEPGRTTLEYPLTDNHVLDFRVTAVFRPGEYRAVVLLYDRVADKRSLEIQDIEVEALKHDPLPGSFRNLPPVEFVTKVSGWDVFYHPELQGKLWLPLETKRPVEIQILVNFGATKQHTGRLAPYYLNIAQMVGALKPLTEIRLLNGTMRVTGFDLNARKIIFDQENLTELDWPRLQEAVSAASPRVVSVEELASSTQRAAFFRDLLAERLRVPGADSATKDGRDPGQASPHRVFIVLSNYILFPRGTDLTPVEPPADCDCRVYHLRYQLLYANWDELEEVMRPLKPRRFDIQWPEHLRKALGQILNELRQL